MRLKGSLAQSCQVFGSSVMPDGSSSLNLRLSMAHSIGVRSQVARLWQISVSGFHGLQIDRAHRSQAV